MNERIRIMGCHILRPAVRIVAEMLQRGLRVIDMRSWLDAGAVRPCASTVSSGARAQCTPTIALIQLP